MEDNYKIIDLCCGCPKLTIQCPGLTNEDVSKGAQCTTMTTITIDGKDYGCPVVGIDNKIRKLHAEGRSIVAFIPSHAANAIIVGS